MKVKLEKVHSFSMEPRTVTIAILASFIYSPIFMRIKELTPNVLHIRIMGFITEGLNSYLAKTFAAPTCIIKFRKDCSSINCL